MKTIMASIDSAYTIEFIGGPNDGDQRDFRELPVDGSELIFGIGHSYTFDYQEWQFIYRGRWRNYTIGNSLLTYRTYDEALRQLGQLQFVGAITAVQSLQIQAAIKDQLAGKPNHV